MKPKQVKDGEYTVILIEDPHGGYTAYYKEYSNVIAEGDTDQEAIENLRHTLEVAKKEDREGWAD